MTEVNRRVQVFCAWCGPAFAVLLFGGWGFMGGFIPLISASDSPAQVALVYSDHPTLHKVGLLLGLVGVFLTIPYFLVISLQLRRMERGVPVLALLQMCSGIIVTVVLIVPMLLFVAGAFRPDRPPELTQLMNDISYVMLILPWPPILGQLFAIAVAVLNDHNDQPVFPRWVAGYQFWVAFLLLPASLIIFFKHGPFAWTGLIGFWIPAAVFGLWYLVMTWVVLRAIRSETVLTPSIDLEFSHVSA
ncbi:MAG: lipoprotein [Marmoricola sp.]|nr:lipoprotein [Marmoricola sp.]